MAIPRYDVIVDRSVLRKGFFQIDIKYPATVVQRPDNFILVDKSISNSFNLCKDLSISSRITMTMHTHRLSTSKWIAAYPLDKIIQPLKMHLGPDREASFAV